MGEMADFYREQELNAQFNHNHEDESIDTSMWETKAGESIFIVKMGDAHLINSHKMITRNNWRKPWLPNIEKELKKRKLSIPNYHSNYGCDASEIDLY